MHLALLTQQISHYHAARIRAAGQQFASISVLSSLNDADFPEFLAGGKLNHAIYRICEGEVDYASAITDGSLWDRVTAVLAERSPDVVAVAGWAFPESLAAIAWARRNGRGVVVMSESQSHDGPRSGLREWLKAGVVRSCDSALVGGASHQAYIEHLGMPTDAIWQGYDVVDNDYYQNGAADARADERSLRQSLSLPARYILASGRFMAKKNFPALVGAFARALQRTDQACDLVILGDGPDRPAIEAAILQQGVAGRVHLPGFKHYDVLPAYYALSEGFVHVSLAEQWGLVVNEAAACGLPLVVSRPCGAAASLVRPGKNGWVVDPTDRADMAAALADMMVLPPQQRAAMGEASQAIVADWGPQRFASGLQAAAAKARAAQQRDLSWLDRQLFRRLARVRMQTVS